MIAAQSHSLTFSGMPGMEVIYHRTSLRLRRWFVNAAMQEDVGCHRRQAFYRGRTHDGVPKIVSLMKEKKWMTLLRYRRRHYSATT
jgi:hypothetical protein